MRKRLISAVKYNKVFLCVYKAFGNAFIAALSLFVRIKKKKILFMSFGGQKFDDSPKELYLKMKDDPYFKDYEMVWGFTAPEKYNFDCKKVRVDTVRFYREALSSGIWINNSSVERGLNIKRKKTIEINTWHGTPLKKIGIDVNENKGTRKRRKKGITLYCAQSEYDRDIFARLFDESKDNFIVADLPRNDALIQYRDEDIERIKKKLEIPIGKKVILYAPTYREFNRDKLNSCYIKPPIDFAKWQNKIGEEYVLLFRAHYEVVKVLGVEKSNFVINVSDYPCLSDLMVVSNLLISDYSSIYFDYSVLEKPMLNFSYDYNEYSKKRGLYLDIKQELGCNVNLNEDSLIEELLSMDQQKYVGYAKKFREKFAPNAGNACETVIGKMKNVLERMDKKIK